MTTADGKTKPALQKPELLLNSLYSFRELIEPILDHAWPQTVCEIGVGQGEFTRFLIQWCQTHDAAYTGIDPTVSPAFVNELSGPKTAFHLVPSLEILPTHTPQDIYFVDGDHNYYTVYNELREIFSKQQAPAVVFIHDTGWPWGRRDQYCNPLAIPEAYRHAHEWEGGVLLGEAGIKPFGFRGKESNYKYAIASQEGGPRNGVLTAFEDACSDFIPADYSTISIPSIFGLSIIYSASRCRAAVVNDVLVPLQKSVLLMGPLLEELEENRNHLFLSFLEGFVYGKWLKVKFDQAQEKVAELEVANARLRDELAQHESADQDADIEMA